MSNEQAIMDEFVAKSLEIIALKETNRDLLKALKNLLKCADAMSEGAGTGWWMEQHAARAAIAKADGEQA